MSAYVCSDLHLVKVAQFAADNNVGLGFAALEIANILLEENVNSVNFRYKENESFVITQEVFNECANEVVEINFAGYENLIDCVGYQSCEHAGWDQSVAKKILDEAKAFAVSQKGNQVASHTWSLD